ncbi:hypothetical protein LPW11_16580 [Geomonas sp. RF6]|uniref:hypothetical protein n=1 Tax=Geomonas sp. RF6 TaxID=2897342 RepID=UPI001E49CF0A|nr:hypothetical protein [Geomonas sp. RF6]UFS69503.1 hypothetical protein LPW11_16580 [Geomonas sp. RF6]
MRMIPKECDHAFETAFGVRHPWQLSSIAISKEKMLFEVVFDYRSCGTERCPFCGENLIDLFFSTKRTWSHVKFFGYDTRMTACLPVFRCSNGRCVASTDREAVLNTLLLDVLLMVSDSGPHNALGTLLASAAPQEGMEIYGGSDDAHTAKHHHPS